MVSHFSLSELKDISFDLDIEYENLPGHTVKNDFARELLSHSQRIGRLHELVQELATIRPNLIW